MVKQIGVNYPEIFLTQSLYNYGASVPKLIVIDQEESA
jgi:hypothetical protein